MKKSLLAVAAMTAFAGAAQAQSSVTVYGIIDAGFAGGTTRVSNQATQTKTNSSQFAQSGETTSRLGFKGTEDLGGGMSAFFTAEFQLQPQDQTLSGNTAGGLVNRQTFVGLSKKGIGQFAVGTQYTSVFSASAATDPGQHNNVIGNVIYPSSTGSTAPGDANNGTVVPSFTNRTSNTLSLASDTFAGFKASGFLTANSKTTNSTTNTAGVVTAGGQTDATGWGLRGEYTLKKFYATAAYQALSQQTASITDPLSSKVWSGSQASGYTAPPSANATDIRDNQFLAGATYDFGILKAYAQYINRKATSTANTNYYLSRSAQQIGVRSFITPKVEGWASVGNGRYRLYGQNAPTANFNAWQLGSNYWLSKRTNLYAIYGQQGVSQAASNTYSGSSNANNYAVGVRHTF